MRRLLCFLGWHKPDVDIDVYGFTSSNPGDTTMADVVDACVKLAATGSSGRVRAGHVTGTVKVKRG